MAFPSPKELEDQVVQFYNSMFDFVTGFDDRIGKSRLKQEQDRWRERSKEGQSRWQDRPPCVVVVGEAKRGKSSLINALLEQVDPVVPVGAGPATNTYLTLYNARRKSAKVRLLNDLRGVREVSLSDLHQWATVEGAARRHEEDDDRWVAGIEIGFPHPLLKQLTIIDTPGVGGLEAKHAEVTQQALADADALLFVLDASSPISKPELEFLGEATTRVATVVFAFTKVDRHPGADAVLRENQLLLENHQRARRLAACRMIPVSSRDYVEALRLEHDGDKPDLAAKYRRNGNIDMLRHELLRLVVGKRTLLRMRNLLHICEDLLKRSTVQADAVLGLLSEDPRLREQQIRAHEEVRRFAATTANWRERLTYDFEQLRRRLQVVNEETQATFRGYEEQLQRSGPRKLHALEGEINYTSMLIQGQLAGVYRDGLTMVLEHLYDAFEVKGLEYILQDLAPPPRQGPATSENSSGSGLGPEARQEVVGGTLDWLSRVASLKTAVTATGAVAASGGVIAVLTGSIVLLPVGIAAGTAGVAYKVIRAKHGDSLKRTNLMIAHGREQSKECLAQYERLVDEVWQMAVQDVDRRLREREVELTTVLRLVETRAEADKANRERRKVRARAQLEEADRLRRRAVSLRRSVDGALGSS